MVQLEKPVEALKLVVAHLAAHQSVRLLVDLQDLKSRILTFDIIHVYDVRPDLVAPVELPGLCDLLLLGCGVEVKILIRFDCAILELDQGVKDIWLGQKSLKLVDLLPLGSSDAALSHHSEILQACRPDHVGSWDELRRLHYRWLP